MKKRQRKNQQLSQVAQPPLNTEPSAGDILGNLFQDAVQIYSKRHNKDVKDLKIFQQIQPSHDNELGSPKYLFDRKYDQLDKKLQKDIKECEGTKKLLILKAAEKYENEGYPLTKICKRITDVLSKGEYRCCASYIREVLPTKYKDPEQMNIARKQSAQVGAAKHRLRDEVANKPVNEITDKDFAYITIPKAKQAFIYQHSQAEWYKGEYERQKIEIESLKEKLSNYSSGVSSPAPIVNEG